MPPRRNASELADAVRPELMIHLDRPTFATTVVDDNQVGLAVGGRNTLRRAGDSRRNRPRTTGRRVTTDTASGPLSIRPMVSTTLRTARLRTVKARSSEGHSGRVHGGFTERIYFRKSSSRGDDTEIVKRPPSPRKPRACCPTQNDLTLANRFFLSAELNAFKYSRDAAES